MPTMNKNGFTMIELTLVILVLSLIAVTAIPDGFWMTSVSLDAATRRVENDIRFAQNMAMTTSDPHGFQVTGNTTYQIYNVNTGVVATSPFTQSPMQVDLDDDFNSTAFNNTTYHIVFDAMGTPTTGAGTIVQINCGTESKQIQISNTSGHVSRL